VVFSSVIGITAWAGHPGQPGHAEAQAYAGALVAANLPGYVLAAHLNRLQRRLFIGWLIESDARQVAERAMAEIRVLRGILPICSFCKRIRHEGRWETVEQYVSQHSEAEFSHGLCPECLSRNYPGYTVDTI